LIVIFEQKGHIGSAAVEDGATNVGVPFELPKTSLFAGKQ
jgi:hypothetical protein